MVIMFVNNVVCCWQNLRQKTSFQNSKFKIIKNLIQKHYPQARRRRNYNMVARKVGVPPPPLPYPQGGGCTHLMQPCCNFWRLNRKTLQIIWSERLKKRLPSFSFIWKSCNAGAYCTFMLVYTSLAAIAALYVAMSLHLWNSEEASWIQDQEDTILY